MESSSSVASSAVVTTSSSSCSSSSFSSTAKRTTENNNTTGNKLVTSTSNTTSSSGRAIHVEDINDETLLRQMWVEASDGESKRQIRSRMYKLREERLKDFYNREGILENILKDEHNNVEVVGEKSHETSSTGKGNTITTKSVTNTIGPESITTTTRVTSRTIIGGDHSNDDDTKDLNKSHINQPQKDRTVRSRKQSEEQIKIVPTSSIAAKVKTTTSTTVVRKNSELNEKANGHKNVDMSTYAAESKSKQIQISKSNGANKAKIAGTDMQHEQQHHSTNLNKLKTNKVSQSSTNGHNELTRVVSNKSSSYESSSHNIINGKGKSQTIISGSKTTTLTGKVGLKSKLSSSSSNPPNSNGNSNPIILKPEKVNVKRTVSNKSGHESQSQTQKHQENQSTARKTTMTSTSSTVNSMKLAKGLYSPPVVKKDIKGRKVPDGNTEKIIPTTKTVSSTPRFMSTTKSREIGIASTQQQFSAHHQTNIASNKVATMQVNLQKQELSGKSSSTIAQSNKSNTCKVKQPVSKSTSNGSAKGDEHNKDKAKSNGKITKSRETSPKSFKNGTKVERTTSNQKLQMKSEVSNSNNNPTTVKKDVELKAKTEESIIRELDNLDNYLYQRSKSIEEAGGEEKKATVSAPLIVIGNVDVEQQMQQDQQVEQKKSSYNLKSKSKEMQQQDRQSEFSKASITTTATKGTRSSTNNNNNNNIGGTHAKQIEVDDNDEIKNKSNSKHRSTVTTTEDVLVSGVEPIFTKSKAFTSCSVTKENDGDQGKSDIHDDHNNQKRNTNREKINCNSTNAIKQTKTSNVNNTSKGKVKVDETKSNKTSQDIETETIAGRKKSKSEETSEDRKKTIVSQSLSNNNAKHTTTTKAQVETQIIIPTNSSTSTTLEDDENKRNNIGSCSITTTRTGEIQQQQKSSSSTSYKVGSSNILESQQEKYDADILSRPSVFDKKKLYESNQKQFSKPSGQVLQTDSNIKTYRRKESNEEKKEKIDDVELRQHKIVKNDSPKNYNDNEKKESHQAMHERIDDYDVDDDDDDDDNPLKPERRFSGQRRNLESPGAVLKAKSLFEHKAHEAAMDKSSRAFSPTTSFRVNKRAALFEARSRGERLSISSDSSYVAEEIQQASSKDEVLKASDDNIRKIASKPVSKMVVHNKTISSNEVRPSQEVKKNVKTTKSDTSTTSETQVGNEGEKCNKTPVSDSVSSNPVTITTRRRSSADFLESIDDIEQLEALLYEATEYDERSRIRARIRTIKRQTTLKKNESKNTAIVGKKVVNSAVAVTPEKSTSHNNEMSKTTVVKKNYESRKSSEEIPKTPQRRRSSELSEQQEATRKRRSSSRKSSGEVTSVKENVTAIGTSETKYSKSSRKYSGEVSAREGAIIDAVEAKPTRSSRKPSGEIKSTNAVTEKVQVDSNEDKKESEIISSSKKMESCFERLASTATIASSMQQSEKAISGYRVKETKMKDERSPSPLIRQPSKIDDGLLEDVSQDKLSSVTKQRKASGERSHVSAISSSTKKKESSIDTSSKEQTKNASNISHDDDLYSRRRSPAKDEENLATAAPNLNTETLPEKKRFPSNKSSGSCAEDKEHTIGVKSTTDETLKENVKNKRKIFQTEKKSSTDKSEKSSRKASAELSKDVEILTTEQLNDIKKKARETTSQEKESSIKQKTIKKEKVVESKSNIPKSESFENDTKSKRKMSGEISKSRKQSSEEQKMETCRDNAATLKSSTASNEPVSAESSESKKSTDERIHSTSTKSTSKVTSDTNNYSKGNGSIGSFSSKRTMSVVKSAIPKLSSDNTDSVTSSYGVGPVDEDGTPLFGLRALRKIKQVQDQQVKSTDQADKVEQSEQPDEVTNFRNSDLYGLRALKKPHEDENESLESGNVIAKITTKTLRTTSTSYNQHNRHHGLSDSEMSNDIFNKLEPIIPETKTTSPTPPSATSPKSILKKTSSFSSNKSESKSDLNVEREREAFGSGNIITSTHISSTGDGGTSSPTFSSRVDSPSILQCIRSRSNSSDDDWIRKSSDGNLTTNVNAASFSRGRIGRSSVKEMSKRFEKTESNVDDLLAAIPRHPSSSSDEGKNITYTKTSRIHKMELKGTEDTDHDDEFDDQIDELNREEHDGRIVTTTKNKATTRSFLTDHSEAKNLKDVLERMSGENKSKSSSSSSGGPGDGSEEEAGRNLLNKFIGAQILMSGIEPILKAGGGTMTTCTSTMSQSLVINGVDIDQEADTDKLRRLLDDCDGVEERGRIETRLKTLGSTAVSTVDQSGASQAMANSNKMVKASSKTSSASASADVTGELMPLILGQLQNSLHNLNNSHNSSSTNNNSVTPAHDNTSKVNDGLSKVKATAAEINSSSSNINNNGGGTSKTQSNNSIIDGNSSASSSLCNSNNNSTTTLVVRSGSTQCTTGGEDGSDSHDEDECLFDSGTESGEDAPPVSSTTNKPPSSSINMLSSSSSSNVTTPNSNANKIVSKPIITTTTPRKKNDPSTSGEFSQFMEGLKHSLQQSASALVLSSLPSSNTQESRKGKGISIGGGRTTTTRTSASNFIEASSTPSDSDLLQQVDSVLSLLKDSLLKDPNYLEKNMATPIIVNSKRGKELIALIDRLKFSLNDSKAESEANKNTTTSEKTEESKSTDILQATPSCSTSENKTASMDEKNKNISEQSSQPQQTSSSSSLFDEVPWKIRAAKKRNKVRSRSIGVSQEELEEARRFLQEEAFLSALKEEKKNEADKNEGSASGEGSKLKSVPGFRPMSWRSGNLNAVPSPFVLATKNDESGNKESLKLNKCQVGSSIDDSSAIVWNKFGLFKPHKPFRTFSLDNNPANDNSILSSAWIHDDPSSILFTPQEVVQIEIHRAAIKKQMSEEEDRRRRRNSISSLQAALSDDGRNSNKPRDFSLTLPKPYLNPSNAPQPQQHSSVNKPPPHHQQLHKYQPSGSSNNSTTSATPTLMNTTDDEQQMVLYDTSSTRSTPTPLQSPTKRSSIDNVQISLKELTSNMFPQLQIAITLNTNNNDNHTFSNSNNNNGTNMGRIDNNFTGTASTSSSNNSAIAPSTGATSSTTSSRIINPNSGNDVGDVVGTSKGISGDGNSRYKNKNERRRRMKKANTIDVPKPYEFGNESEDDEDDVMSDSSSVTGVNNPMTNTGSNPTTGSTTTTVTNLGFIPKTESDKKFYAFLEKNNEQNVASGSNTNSSRFPRPLSHLAVRDSHFSNLKTSFESSTSQGSSPSLSPIPSSGISPSIKHVEDLAEKQQQVQYSSKPVWAAKSDNLLAKSPLSVKNKLSVFEYNDPQPPQRVPNLNAPPQELWKSNSPEIGASSSVGYHPHVQTKPSSLLAKKASYEKFAEEHSQAQQQIQKRPIPAVRTRGKQTSGKPSMSPSPPPLPPKAAGVHIVHATKSAMDAIARQRSNFSPLQQVSQQQTPIIAGVSDQPPLLPPRASHSQFKSLPSSPTIEKPEAQWAKVKTGIVEPSRNPVSTAAPQFTNPKVQMNRELFEAKQREAILTPVPHPPPQSHVHVTVPLQQQQKSMLRLESPFNNSRSFEEEGMGMTSRSPFIAVKKIEVDKSRNLQNNSRESPSSPSGGQVEKISVVFQPIAHGKSFDSSNYYPPQSGQQSGGNNQQLHPKLAVFGVTRSIDDERVVKGRLELESNKNKRREGIDDFVNQGILNTAFAPVKTSAFVARKFENKNLEPLPQLRRQSIPPSGGQSSGQASPTSPAPTLISPVVSKVMKGPQQQRATLTRKEVSSLGSDHPSAHRIRGDNNVNTDSNEGHNPPTTDSARQSIRSILGQFQQTETDAEKSTPGKVFYRHAPGGGLVPSLPLKKSHSGDALLQTHFLPGGHGHLSRRTSHFVPTTTIEQTKEESPQPQHVKFQPFQSHGFVQARSRFIEQQQPAVPQSQPSLQKPAAGPTSVQQKVWGSQGMGGSVASSGNPFIPRQRSLSNFPPSSTSQQNQAHGQIQSQQPKPKPLVLSSFVSVSSPSVISATPTNTNNVNRIRFPPQESQQQQYQHQQQQQQHQYQQEQHQHHQSSQLPFADQIQRTSSGSSIFDRTKSLYISTQDSIGATVKPKRRPPPSALPKSKTLFPKQYEAQMSPDSVDKKRKEVEAFFKAVQKPETNDTTKSSTTTSASSHYRKLRHQNSHNGNDAAPAASTRIRKSASQGKLMHRQRSYSDGDDDVDEIFESLFNTAVESKFGKDGEESMTVKASAVQSKQKQQSEAQCQVQNKASASTMHSAGPDGSSSTKTIKQQSSKTSSSFKSASSSSTASASTSVTSSATASPFSKFKQLDQQNSPVNKSGGPIFKFTNEALKTSATSAKDVLLYWCQCRVRDYQNVKIENFSSSWSDGLAFCALIHHFYPDAFDYSKLDAKNRRHNFELAFRVAEEQADIYPLLDTEDMMVMGKKPDWKCVFTYVQSVYRKLK